MWFGFGLITLLVAFGVSVVLRLRANWRGDLLTLDGREYRRSVTKNKGRIRSVNLGVTVPEAWDFSLRNESKGDAWFKRIGISAELEVGDRRFDDAMYLVSDDPDFGQLLRNSRTLRDTLLALFAAPTGTGLQMVRVRCAYGRLWAELANDGEPAPEPASKAVVPLLHAVAEELRLHPRARSKTRDPFVLRAALLLSVSTATAIYGVVGLFRAGASQHVLEAWQLFLFTLVPSLVALGFFLAAIVAVLGRSSRTHLVLIEALIVGAFGFVMTGHALGREVNFAFDTAPASRIDVQDIETEHRTSRSRKGGTKHSYLLHVDDWREPGFQRMTLSIDASTYSMLRNSRDAAIIVRRGALGFEWIERIEHVDARPPG